MKPKGDWLLKWLISWWVHSTGTAHIVAEQRLLFFTYFIYACLILTEKRGSELVGGTTVETWS